MARRELVSLGVSKNGPANWSDSSVSKIYHSFSSNRRKQEDLRFSKTAPAAQHPPKGPPANWSKLGGSWPAANWRDLRVSKIDHSFPAR
jgi:hypothetical protein